MADNNGIGWSVVTPFANAGIRNILWLPNRWNPKTVDGSRADVAFEADGTLSSIYDKELNRELLDQEAVYRAIQFVYTKDNHETFISPKQATFVLKTDAFGQTVSAILDDPATQAKIVQEISLPNDEKRIDIDNRFSHVHDLFNKNRYYRFGYYAFPFKVAIDEGWNSGPVSELLSVKTDAKGDSPPAPIGSIHTGLVTIPRAAHGDNPDHLYLEWGQNMESDLSHYELYRSEKQGFTPDESNFVQKVEQGPYRVVAFEKKFLVFYVYIMYIEHLFFSKTTL